MELDLWRTWWRHSGESELRHVVMASWDPIGVASLPADLRAAHEIGAWYVVPTTRFETRREEH
jgi:hypothetical protein